MSNFSTRNYTTISNHQIKASEITKQEDTIDCARCQKPTSLALLSQDNNTYIVPPSYNLNSDKSISIQGKNYNSNISLCNNCFHTAVLAGSWNRI